LRIALLALELQKLRAQNVHRDLAILDLGTLLLRSNDRVGRNVDDPDGRLGLVDVLPAGAPRFEGLDAQIIGLDVEVDFLAGFDLRNDVDGRERGMPAMRRVERGEADQTMDAALALEQTVRVLAADE